MKLLSCFSFFSRSSHLRSSTSTSTSTDEVFIPPHPSTSKPQYQSVGVSNRIGRAPKGPRKRLSVKVRNRWGSLMGGGNGTVKGGNMEEVVEEKRPLEAGIEKGSNRLKNRTTPPSNSTPSPPPLSSPTSLESLQSQLSISRPGRYPSPSKSPNPGNPNPKRRKAPPPVTASIIKQVGTEKALATAVPPHLRRTESPPPVEKSPPAPLSNSRPPDQINSFSSGLIPPTLPPKTDAFGRPIVAVIGDVEMSKTLKKEWDGQLESISEALKIGELQGVADDAFTVEELLRRQAT